MDPPVEMMTDFRLAIRADVSTLAQMNHWLIQDEGHRNPMSLAELESRMRAWLDGEYHAALFEEGDRTVGYALYRFDEEWVYLRQFFVQREDRRKGIGRAALRWLAANPWKGTPRIRLEVLSGNLVGQEFWKALGFEVYALTFELDPLPE